MNRKISLALLALLFVAETSPIAISAEEIINDNSNTTSIVDTVEQSTETTTADEVETEETTTADEVESEETTTEDEVETEETTTEDEVESEETTTEDEVVTEEATTEDEVESEETITMSLTDATTADDVIAVRASNSGEAVAASNTVSGEKSEIDAGSKEITFNVDEVTIVDNSENMKMRNENSTNIDIDVETLSSDLNITASSTDEEVNNLISNIDGDQFVVGTNGEIIAADETNFITIGGVDYTSYVYPSLDLIGDTTNAVTVHGGAQSGKYLETVYNNGDLYAHVIIGGYEGYMDLNDIQILPGEFELPETYYSNVNGVWTKFVPVDSLQTSTYNEYQVGTASSDMAEGVKYYTTDDYTYYADTIANSRGTKAVATGATYFQNLPFRSTSDYTAEEMQQYLASIGASNSKYYNSTQAFVDAQAEYGINALYLFAHANHESAYGTSSYAQLCNNFFGRAAVDSDPDKACQGSMGWPTAEDGILAEGVFLTQNYADVNWWGYFGTHPGNKVSGINAVYASDVDWGVKVANHMYRMDQYFGGREEGEYKIYSMDYRTESYSNSELTTLVEEMGYGTENGSIGSNYYQHRNINVNYGQTEAASPRVVVTDETADAFEYQIDQALALSSAYYTFNQGFTGTFPYFEGNTSNPFGGEGQAYENYVIQGYSNFTADYGTDWSKQQVWYPKVADGYSTYSVINDVEITEPELPGTEVTEPEVDTETICTYDNEGYVENCKKYEDDVLVSIYDYYPETEKSEKGYHIKYRFNVDANGVIEDATKYEDGTKQHRIAIYNYYSGTKYNDNGSHGDHIKYRFDLKDDETLDSASHYPNYRGEKDLIYTYYDGTKYRASGEHGNHIKNRFELEDARNVASAKQYTDDTHKLKTIYSYYGTPEYGKHGSHIQTKYHINTSGILYRAEKLEDVTADVLYTYEYYSGTKYSATGEHGDHIKFRFNHDENEYVETAYKYEDGTHALLKKYWYDPYTVYGNHADHISDTYTY